MMRRLTILATLLLLLLLPMGVASAHGGTVEGLYHQTVQAGPYKLILDFTDWPLQAKKSNRIIVAPEGGIEGKTGVLTISSSNPLTKPKVVQLKPYPGLQGAWMFETTGLPTPDPTTFSFTITGLSGDGIGNTGPLQVMEPPRIPMWFGWVLGLFPLYGLAWFGVREVRRVKKETKQKAA
jgi:hypothetical protein